MKDRGVNIVATSNSWGGGGYSQALYDAIDAQRQRGILFIAAAGQQRGQQRRRRPTIRPTTTCPTSSPWRRRREPTRCRGFSNYGRHTVHLGAPGSEILSTTPNNNTYFDLQRHVDGDAARGRASPRCSRRRTRRRDWRAIKNLILAGGDNDANLSKHHHRQAAQRVRVAHLLEPDGVLAPEAGAERDHEHGRRDGAHAVRAEHQLCGRQRQRHRDRQRRHSVITLKDDGVAPDQVAGDGIYSGSFAPAAIGSASSRSRTPRPPPCWRCRRAATRSSRRPSSTDDITRNQPRPRRRHVGVDRVAVSHQLRWRRRQHAVCQQQRHDRRDQREQRVRQRARCRRRRRATSSRRSGTISSRERPSIPTSSGRSPARRRTGSSSSNGGTSPRSRAPCDSSETDHIPGGVRRTAQRNPVQLQRRDVWRHVCVLRRRRIGDDRHPELAGGQPAVQREHGERERQHRAAVDAARRGRRGVHRRSVDRRHHAGQGGASLGAAYPASTRFAIGSASPLSHGPTPP